MLLFGWLVDIVSWYSDWLPENGGNWLRLAFFLRVRSIDRINLDLLTLQCPQINTLQG